MFKIILVFVLDCKNFDFKLIQQKLNLTFTLEFTSPSKSLTALGIFSVNISIMRSTSSFALTSVELCSFWTVPGLTTAVVCRATSRATVVINVDARDLAIWHRARWAARHSSAGGVRIIFDANWASNWRYGIVSSSRASRSAVQSTCASQTLNSDSLLIILLKQFNQNYNNYKLKI